MKSHKRTNTRPGEQSQTKQFRKKKEPNPSSKTQQNAAEQQWISVYLFMSSFCERTPHPSTPHPTAFFLFFFNGQGSNARSPFCSRVFAKAKFHKCPQ